MSRASWAAVTAGAGAAIVVGLVAWAVSRESDGAPASGSADPGPVHVHALGSNPADDALFIATHTGLYAVSPVDPRRIVVASAGGLEEGLFESRDGGNTWERIGDVVGLLAWPAQNGLYVVTGGGRVLVSTDGGRRLDRRGDIGGEPAALLGRHPDELYVALHDGTIERSADAGATWTVRSTP